MDICIVGGAGYVGLITSLGLAELGHSVTSVDVDEARVGRLRNADPPIHEDGILAFLRRNLDAGRLKLSTDLGGSIDGSDVVFIAVGTPSHDDGQADLSQVIQVTEEMAQFINEYKVIVVKSTVPVGTVELMLNILRRERREGDDFDVVSNPEFLREGKGLYDFFYPDRIVLGASSERARSVMRDLYGPLIDGWQGDVPGAADNPLPSKPVEVVETDLASAQMIKYASNAFLATRVSYINEIAAVCESVGADVTAVVEGMGYDERIGHNYLQPGLGFGGPCLEKDLRALIKISEGNGHEPQLLRTVLDRNQRQIGEVVARVKRLTGYLLYRKRLAVFGLSFKAGTNDVRNSLALKVIDCLEEEGATVIAHDPAAIQDTRAARPNLDCREDPYDTVDGADALLILTEWPAFRDLDYAEIARRMASPGIVDGRNLLDPKTMRSLGFRYVGIGRP